MGDLFTELHDQYNTIPNPIQDKVAFHHDVYEISSRACSKDEFHSLMAKRKEQRIDELNKSLELASVKIISNPSLIGTDQWALAIQLFRERSLDALVGYFSSYLPESYWESDSDTLREESEHSSTSSRSSTISSVSTATTTDVHPEVVPDNTLLSEKAITYEPLCIKTSHSEPLSPPSSEHDADSIATSPTDLESQDGDDLPVASAPTPRSLSMSFSGSELGLLPSYHHNYQDRSYVDIVEPVCEPFIDDNDTRCDHSQIKPDSLRPTDDHTVDSFSEPSYHNTPDVESDDTTPRAKFTTDTTSFVIANHGSQTQRSPSPSVRTRLVQADARKFPLLRKREPASQVSRTPCEMLCRIQKPVRDEIRCRPKQRRRVKLDF